VNLNFFAKKKNKASIDLLQRMQGVIDLQLRTFSSQLKQFSGQYESLHEDNLKVIKLLEKKK